MATTRATTVQEAVDRIGFGRFQKRLLAVCGVTWAADGAEVLLLGFALPSIIGEFGITTAQGGLIASATFAGMLVGASSVRRARHHRFGVCRRSRVCR